jgi:hypothetical protein
MVAGFRCTIVVVRPPVVVIQWAMRAVGEAAVL